MEWARARLRALANAGRLGQFLSVGVVGTGCDVVVSTSLNELGVFEELAVLAGIETAIVVMFVINDRWTFAEEGGDTVRELGRRFATSHLVRSGGILVQLAVFSGIYRLFYTELSLFGLEGWFVVAKLGGIVVGGLVNYVAESLLTWKVHR
jgi:putative flippase GtrA